MNAESPAVEVMPPPEPWQVLPEGEYAIAEFFGHTTMVGRISEVERFGCKMLALEPLFNGALLAAVFNGGASIYRLTPCTKQIAWEKQPRNEYQLPPSVRAIAPAVLLAPPESADTAHWERGESDDPDGFPV